MPNLKKIIKKKPLQNYIRLLIIFILLGLVGYMIYSIVKQNKNVEGFTTTLSKYFIVPVNINKDSLINYPVQNNINELAMPITPTSTMSATLFKNGPLGEELNDKILKTLFHKNSGVVDEITFISSNKVEAIKLNDNEVKYIKKYENNEYITDIVKQLNTCTNVMTDCGVFETLDDTKEINSIRRFVLVKLTDSADSPPNFLQNTLKHIDANSEIRYSINDDGGTTSIEAGALPFNLNIDETLYNRLKEGGTTYKEDDVSDFNYYLAFMKINKNYSIDNKPAFPNLVREEDMYQNPTDTYLNKNLERFKHVANKVIIEDSMLSGISNIDGIYIANKSVLETINNDINSKDKKTLLYQYDVAHITPCIYSNYYDDEEGIFKVAKINLGTDEKVTASDLGSNEQCGDKLFSTGVYNDYGLENKDLSENNELYGFDFINIPIIIKVKSNTTLYDRELSKNLFTHNRYVLKNEYVEPKQRTLIPLLKPFHITSDIEGELSEDTEFYKNPTDTIPESNSVDYPDIPNTTKANTTTTNANTTTTNANTTTTKANTTTTKANTTTTKANTTTTKAVILPGVATPTNTQAPILPGVATPIMGCKPIYDINGNMISCESGVNSCCDNNVNTCIATDDINYDIPATLNNKGRGDININDYKGNLNIFYPNIVTY